MYYVGIDVSKPSVDICLLAEGIKGKRKTKTLSNGQDSAQALVKWLVLQKRDPSQAHIIVEATGIYHEHLACGLHQKEILISVINPCRAVNADRIVTHLAKVKLALPQPGWWQINETY